MKTSLALGSLLLALASGANADTKVAEYGDPVIGNSYGGCNIQQTYRTGAVGLIYTEYTITCPSGGPYKVGVQYDPHASNRKCTFTTGDSSYYAVGTCENWRVYKY